MAHGERSETLWSHTALPRGGAAPRGDVCAEVVVVGAGITGITTALLLQREGQRVVLLEARRGAGGDTGRSTTHCTAVLDVRYHALRRWLGDEDARHVARAAWGVLDTLEALAAELAPGTYVRRPMLLVTEKRAHERDLEQELGAMRALGLPTARLTREGLPYPQARLGLRLEQQGQLEPRAHCAGLLQAFLDAGGTFHEGARVDGVQDGTPCTVRLEGATLHAGAVVLATHVPLQSFLLIPRLPQSRTYVVATEVQPGFPDALLYDTADPYHYVRLQRHTDGVLAILGGEDHRVGTRNDGPQREEALLRWARERLPVGRVVRRWSGQLVDSLDGLPLVGRNPLDQRIYVATGYAGNGITWGTVAAHLLTDLVLGRDNPLARVLSPGRFNREQLERLPLENVGFPTYLVKDRLRPRDAARSLAQVPAGEGRIVRVGGRRLAVSRDMEGRYTACSPVCPHMGCLVRWNSTERSWDCPCHGSRFDPRGELLNGPAPRGLEPRSLPPGLGLTEAPAQVGEDAEEPQDALELLEQQHRELEALFRRYERLPTGDVEARRRLFLQVADALTAHTRLEEQAFYPALRRAGSAVHVAQARREHAAVDGLLVALLDTDASDPAFDARMAALEHALDVHMREEEESLFVRARRLMGAEALEALGLQLREHTRHPPREEGPQGAGEGDASARA